MRKRRLLLILAVSALALAGGFGLFLKKTRGSKVNYDQSAMLLSRAPVEPIAGTPSLTPAPSATPKAGSNPTNGPVINEAERVLISVPFTSQAPLGEWEDPLQQDGCEEASSLMAARWVKGGEIGSPEEARAEMLAVSAWEIENFGNAHDTSAHDTADRIIKGYYGWAKVEVKDIENPREIIDELVLGHLVILPVDGRAIGNPHFTQPGPERHMLVVKGYDPSSLEFITNDPGTRFGEGYRYSVNVLWSSIRDYPTGEHDPITAFEKRMIVVEK